MKNVGIYLYGTIDDNGIPFPFKGYPDFRAVLRDAKNFREEYVLIADAGLARHINVDFLHDVTLKGDIMHCGLSLGARNVLRNLQLILLTWFFLDPESNGRCVSWKATAGVMLIRNKILQREGLCLEYMSNDMVVMDLAYRVLRQGAEVYHEPDLLRQAPATAPVMIDEADEFLFVRRNLPKKTLIVLVYKFLSFGNWLRSIKNYRKSLSFPTIGSSANGKNDHQIIRPAKLKTIGDYSAIIPTLNRYEYLPGAIESLLNQSVPPYEIVIFDQTPPEKRDQSVVEKYQSEKVRFIFSEKRGQSLARNNALYQTRHEWCLLFDDDSVADRDMAKAHITLLENSDHWVSTGASLAPGTSFADLPYTIDFFHVADVLDSGNCFINKRVLEEVGYFDDAFNHGPGADDDLGRRIYKKGYTVIFNPKSVRIHYKAESGGLRVYGAIWRNKSTLLGPYPPATQVYMIRKYYPKEMWRILYLNLILKAKKRLDFFSYLIFLILLPYKFFLSLKKVKELELRSK